MLETLALRAYTGLWWLALPALPLRLWWRGRREPGYRRHVGERFGSYRTGDGGARDVSASFGAPLVWIHAVSVGETRAATSLVDTVLRELPEARVLLTHMTAAGRDAGAALAGPRVRQCFLPYDVPFAVDRFLAHFRPTVGLLMETEVWPNLILRATRAGVPVYLVNARLSARSAGGYARWPRLVRPAFAALAGVAAQTPDDAERLRALGARDPAVTGNVKFDVAVSDTQRALGAALRARFGPERPVWIAGSTREGEETMLLDAMAGAGLPRDALLVLVPRHPQRFDEVGRLLAARGIAFERRSDDRPVPPGTSVVLGDSMGELIAYYASADVALIGGSFLALGGQNPIEAMAVGRPVVVGPHTFNFAEVTRAAVEAGAALRASDAGDALRIVASLLVDAAARERIGLAGARFASAHRGATRRTWSWITEELARRGVALGARVPDRTEDSDRG